MVVVFPAPLGPRTAVTAPAAAENESPSTATTAPYRTSKSMASTAAATVCHATVAHRPPPVGAPLIDIRHVRTDPEGVRKALSRRDPALAASVDALVDLDRRARELTTRRDELRADRKS